MIEQKRKSHTIIFRLLFVVGIIVIFFVMSYYKCIKLSISATPGIITQIKNKPEVILLYGPGVCGTCHPGRRLLSMKQKSDYTIIVPGSFTDADIYNLKDAFMIKGEVVRGNLEIEEYLKKIASCKELSDWQTNIFLELEKNGNIKKISQF
jgi:hypothetical protein